MPIGCFAARSARTPGITDAQPLGIADILVHRHLAGVGFGIGGGGLCHPLGAVVRGLVDETHPHSALSTNPDFRPKSPPLRPANPPKSTTAPQPHHSRITTAAVIRPERGHPASLAGARNVGKWSARARIRPRAHPSARPAQPLSHRALIPPPRDHLSGPRAHQAQAATNSTPQQSSSKPGPAPRE